MCDGVLSFPTDDPLFKCLPPHNKHRKQNTFKECLGRRNSASIRSWILDGNDIEKMFSAFNKNLAT